MSVAEEDRVLEREEWEEMMPLRSLRVSVCWDEIASIKVLVEEMSGRMLASRGVSFEARASEKRTALVSRMSSSMMNTAA